MKTDIVLYMMQMLLALKCVLLSIKTYWLHIFCILLQMCSCKPQMLRLTM